VGRILSGCLLDAARGHVETLVGDLAGPRRVDRSRVVEVHPTSTVVTRPAALTHNVGVRGFCRLAAQPESRSTDAEDRRLRRISARA